MITTLAQFKAKVFRHGVQRIAGHTSTGAINGHFQCTGLYRSKVFDISPQFNNTGFS